MDFVRFLMNILGLKSYVENPISNKKAKKPNLKSICVFPEKKKLSTHQLLQLRALLQSIPEHYRSVWSLHLYLCFVFLSFFSSFLFSSLNPIIKWTRLSTLWLVFLFIFWFLYYFSTTTATTTSTTTTSDNFFISSIITGYKEL